MLVSRVYSASLSLCLLVFLGLITPPANASGSCSGKITVEQLGSEDYLHFEGIPVTGESFWRLNQVYFNLGLRYGLPGLSRSSRILSTAEGLSGLVESLRMDDFRNAQALDPLYAERNLPEGKLGEEAWKYIVRNRHFLLEGRAEDTGLNDESVDLLLNHMLVSNLNKLFGKHASNDVVKESFRLLRPCGHAIISGFHNMDGLEMLQALGGPLDYESFSWRAAGLRAYYNHLLGPTAHVSVRVAHSPFLTLVIRKINAPYCPEATWLRD